MKALLAVFQQTTPRAVGVLIAAADALDFRHDL
jgi:hypothetical protein